MRYRLKTFTGRMFIDATYEGDLQAAALAIEGKTAVQDVPCGKLEAQLRRDGQILE